MKGNIRKVLQLMMTQFSFFSFKSSPFLSTLVSIVMFSGDLNIRLVPNLNGKSVAVWVILQIQGTGISVWFMCAFLVWNLSDGEESRPCVQYLKGQISHLTKMKTGN